MCSYDYTRDCKENGVQGFCVAGAIANFSQQVDDCTLGGDKVAAARSRALRPRYCITVLQGKLQASVDPTSALKFVIHFVGDIHQPLHTGFTGDEVKKSGGSGGKRWDRRCAKSVLPAALQGRKHHLCRVLWLPRQAACYLGHVYH